MTGTESFHIDDETVRSTEIRIVSLIGRFPVLNFRAKETINQEHYTESYVISNFFKSNPRPLLFVVAWLSIFTRREKSVEISNENIISRKIF